jgi:hypothetical protein
MSLHIVHRLACAATIRKKRNCEKRRLGSDTTAVQTRFVLSRIARLETEL